MKKGPPDASDGRPEKPKRCTALALNRKPGSGLAAETTTKENYLHPDSMLSVRDASRVALSQLGNCSTAICIGQCCILLSLKCRHATGVYNTNDTHLQSCCQTGNAD